MIKYELKGLRWLVNRDEQKDYEKRACEICENGDSRKLKEQIASPFGYYQCVDDFEIFICLNCLKELASKIEKKYETSI